MNIAFSRSFLLLLLITLGSHRSFLPDKKQAIKKGYNVLFIAIDDLRPDLGCYGNAIVQSPHIDRLAEEATIFTNHFVTVPTCGPSRMSLLTGRWPRSAEDLSNDVLELRKAKGSSSRPESFVENLRLSGYYTVGIGKISHAPDGYIYKYGEPKGKEMELPRSWNEMLFDPGTWGTGWNAFFGYADGSNRNSLKGASKPYEAATVSDAGYPDGLTTALAISKLKELRKRAEPFFLGVGFFKPHLPFNAPKKYWDLYDQAVVPLSPAPGLPANVHLSSLQESGEFNSYKLGEEKAGLAKPLSDAYARKLRHGYYASISYIDAQVGALIRSLKQLGLYENTIVVVWGDHGWHLGDNRVWGKHTIREWSLRSPLIIKVPGKAAGASSQIVSSVDIYPTLMELCGVSMRQPTDGKSLVRLLGKKATTYWENVAYSYYRNGITLRTARYRLTKYFRKDTPVTELYDHSLDPYEQTNIAAQHPEVVEQLMPLWEKGNTGLYKNP